MAVPPERSRPLHNFALPHLKWGNQRFLRCMKVNNANGQTSGSNRRSSVPESQSNGVNRRRPGKEVINRRSPNANESSRKSPSKPIGADAVRYSDSDQDRDKDGIEAVREKLMLDLRVAADRMKVSMLEEKGKELDDSNSARSWNLRTRRAACTAPNGLGGGKKPVSCNSSSPLRAASPMATAKSSRLRGLASVAAAATSSSEEKSERPKFSISLTREEIESDFIAMTGMKPPRRPKRRPKAVQRQLDTLLPGAWLTEITPETYRVPDFPESGKG